MSENKRGNSPLRLREDMQTGRRDLIGPRERRGLEGRRECLSERERQRLKERLRERGGC